MIERRSKEGFGFEQHGIATFFDGLNGLLRLCDGIGNLNHARGFGLRNWLRDRWNNF